MNKEINKAATEFADSFNQFTDVDIIIIRGHVLIERQLINAIEACVTRPSEFFPEKVSFANKVMLAHMLGISNSFKVELNALNKLRNQVAHSLVYDVKLSKTIVQEVKKKWKMFDDSQPLERQLSSAISFIAGAIHMAGVKRLKFREVNP